MRSFPLAEYEQRVPIRIGSLSQCFAARHASGEEVLLKQLLPAFARVPAMATAWLERAEQNARLDHPGCGRVLEWGEALGESYLTLPLVAAASLRELLQAAAKAGLWPRVEAVAAIAQGALSALAYAHGEFALVHLDLDPRAVLLRKDGSVVLTEFGMWRALPAEVATSERFDRGRVAYLSPELTKSLAGDARSDVFSLGAILYELLGKERPFQGATQLVTAMAIAEGRRRPLRELAPQAPEVLCDIVETMLAQKPEERFQSAQAALGAFSSCCQADALALADWLESLELRAGPQAGFARARHAVPSAAVQLAGAGGRDATAAAGRQPDASAAPALFAGCESAGEPVFGAAAASVHGSPPSPPPPPLLSPAAQAAPAAACISAGAGSDEWLAPPPLLSPGASPAALAARALASGAGGPAVRDGHTAFLDASGATSPPAMRAPDSAPPLGSPPRASDAALPPSRLGEMVARAAPVLGHLVAPRLALASAAAKARLGPLPPPSMPAESVSALSPREHVRQEGEECGWREPSKTVFQAKVFAKHATRRRTVHAPLSVVVLLSVAFGFAVVAGGALLWRLIAS